MWSLDVLCGEGVHPDSLRSARFGGGAVPVGDLLSHLALVAVTDEVLATGGRSQTHGSLRARSEANVIVGVAVSSAAPGSHLQSRQGVELDDAVGVAEKDRHRQEDEVARVAAEEIHELHDLRESENEDDLSPKHLIAAVHVPLSGALPQRQDDERIEKEGQGGKRGDVERVGAPGLLGKNVSLSDKAGPVTAPVATSPSRALVKELGTVLEGGLELTLLLVLNPGLPLVADEPAGDKIIIVSVEDVFAPFLRLEAL